MEQAVKSDTTNDQSINGAESLEIKADDRSKDEYAKRVKELADESKANRQKASDYKAKFEALERKSLEEQGNFKNLYEAERSKLEQVESDKVKMKAAYAFKAVTSELSRIAQGMGCIDTEALIRLADLKSLDVRDDFSLEPDSVKSLIENFAKEKPYLFQKSAPTVRDGAPAKTITGGLSDLTLQEKLRLLAEQTR